MKNEHRHFTALRQSLRTRAFRSGSYSFFVSAVVIAIAAVLLLLIGRLPKRLTRYDMTAQKLLELSPETRETVSALTQEVDIYLLATAGSEDTLLTALLERYEGLSDQIRVSAVDPVANPGFHKQYTDELRYNNSVLVISGSRSRFIDYYDIYEYDYSDYYSGYDESDISLSFNGEGAVTSAIAYVSGTELQKLYCLTGHGEAALGSTFRRAAELQNYEITDISLLTESAVPADCACLLINAPTADLSTPDVEKLEAYLAADGRLLLFAGYNETGTPQPQLAALLTRCGGSLADGLVMEENQKHYYQYGYMLLPEYGGHEIVAPLKESGFYVLTPNAAALDIADPLPEGVSAEVLLSTDENAYLAADPTDLLKKDGDRQGVFTLAAAFTVGDGRAVWVGSSYVTDESVNSFVSGGNLDLFLNALNWGSGREGGVSIHPKSLSEETFTLSDAELRIYELVLVILIPLLAAAAGVIVTVRRRRRQ